MVYGPDDKFIKGNLTITGDGSGTLDLKELEVKGDLIVDLPNATVKNQAKVDGYVMINDISENTWVELVDNNKLIFASENDTLIISDNISPKSVELKTGATLVISEEIPVKAKKGIKILVKASEKDQVAEIVVNTEEDYENITLSDKVTQEEIDKEIEEGKKVKKLIDKIESLDNISLEDAKKVASIREEYDALEENKKALIPNLWKLEDAEARIKKLEAEKAEEERQAKVVVETLQKIGTAQNLEALKAIKIDKSLSEANKSTLLDAKSKKKLELEKLESDKEVAGEVDKKIESLGEITLNSKDAVEAARDSYNKLTYDQKELVTNLKILKDAEAELDDLRKEALENLNKNIGNFEATAIRLLNQQGRFHLEKISENEISFEFITEGNIGSIFKPNYSKEPATIQTPMSNYSRGSGLATVLGQKSDSNGKAQKARIDTIKEYIDMETATIDGKKFEGLDSMFQIYNMKVGDFLGNKTGKVKVKSEIAEDMYLEYTINFSLPENK